MKKYVIITILLVFIINAFAQSNTNFCDPELQNELENIANMGGTYLKDFLVSPQDLNPGDKVARFNMVLLKGCTYRFYFKTSSKIKSECTFMLMEKDCSNQAPILTLSQKSGDKVAFGDITIVNTGSYYFLVSFANNVEGCALVCLNFINSGTKEAAVDTSEVYTTVDEEAQFEGGDLNNFVNFIAQKLVIDSELKKKVIGKRAIIQFIVNTAGKVEKPKILRSSGAWEVDLQAQMIIESSPAWKPAKIKGINVKQIFIIPITIN